MARILIVDDEPSILLAVRDELLFEGFEVESAVDGPEAIKRAHELRPDVLLLDLMLPGLNGFEVCRQLRSEMPEMWIIMLTVRGQEVDRVMGLELGADVYVTHRVIDTHMASLRKKIEDDPNNPEHILSVRGVGYRLDANPSES